MLLVHGPETVDDVAHLVADLRARLEVGASLEYLQADYGRLAAVSRLAGEVMATTDRLAVIIKWHRRAIYNT